MCVEQTTSLYWCGVLAISTDSAQYSERARCLQWLSHPPPLAVGANIGRFVLDTQQLDFNVLPLYVVFPFRSQYMA